MVFLLAVHLARLSAKKSTAQRNKHAHDHDVEILEVKLVLG